MKELTNTTCTAIVKFYKKQLARSGIADMFVSDNGSQFLCAEFSDSRFTCLKIVVLFTGSF